MDETTPIINNYYFETETLENQNDLILIQLEYQNQQLGNLTALGITLIAVLALGWLYKIVSNTIGNI